MDRELEEIKEEMTQELREGLDKLAKGGLGTLEQMEEAVGAFKAELGRKALERLIALKKTRNKKD